MGGYGSAVLALLSDHGVAVPVVRLAWPDVFVEHASTVEYLRERHGLTAANLVRQIREKLAGAAQAGQLTGGLRTA